MNIQTMFSRSLRTQGWFCLMCLLACNFIFPFNAKADKGVDWDGKWGDGWERSIANYPVASYDESFLYIETTSARSDIQIRILDGATVVYETTLYAPDTFIAISLEQLEDGTYGVELTNQWGDYLYGEFER